MAKKQEKNTSTLAQLMAPRRALEKLRGATKLAQVAEDVYRHAHKCGDQYVAEIGDKDVVTDVLQVTVLTDFAEFPIQLKAGHMAKALNVEDAKELRDVLLTLLPLPTRRTTKHTTKRRPKRAPRKGGRRVRAQ